MKREANLGALNELMAMIMPSQASMLERKKKKDKNKEIPLATKELVEDDSSEEPIVKPSRSISYSEISLATKKEPKSSSKISSKNLKRKGRRR